MIIEWKKRSDPCICWRVTVAVCTLITDVETYCTLHPCMYFVVFVFTLHGRISLCGKPQGSSRLKTSVWPKAPYNCQHWVMHGEHAALGARTVILGKILNCYCFVHSPWQIKSIIKRRLYHWLVLLFLSTNPHEKSKINYPANK